MDERVDDAGLARSVPGVADQNKLRLRPCFVKFPCGLHRSDDVIAALDDDGRDVSYGAHICENMVVAFEKSAIDEVVTFDARESDRKRVAAKTCNALF